MNTNIASVLDAYTVKIIELGPEDGGGYKATFDELGLSATGYGETRGEAMEALQESAVVLAESMAEDGEGLPEPAVEPEWQDYSGRVTLRLPKALHALLDRLADEQDVSLNSLMASMLQSGATALAAGVPFGPMHCATVFAERALLESREQYDRLSTMIEGLATFQTVSMSAFRRPVSAGTELVYERIS